MTAHTAVTAQTGTVATGTVDSITFSNMGSQYIITVHNTEKVWVRFGNSLSEITDPAVDGDDCFPVLGIGARSFRWQGKVIKITGDSGTSAEYTVEVQP